MDFPALIDSYGYLAVFVGAFLEGETILALAGLASSRGYLNLAVVIAIAMAAGFLGDQFFFFLGRVKGQALLHRFPHWRSRAHRFDAMLSRWHAPLIVGIRFMYGFRILGPIMLGMGRVAAWKFVVFNLIGAAIWAPLIAGLGYIFGSILERVLSDLQHVELWAAGIVIAIAAGVAVLHRMRDRDEEDDAP